MRVGVIGSESFPQPKLVEYMVGELPQGVTIVTRDAGAVEETARRCAEDRGLLHHTHEVDLQGAKEKTEVALRHLARDQEVVADCDLLVVFVERTQGAAWSAVLKAHAVGKTVKVIRPTLVMAPPSPPSVEGGFDEVVHKRAQRKGQGPFAIKRVGLGSYALRRRCYLTDERWAEVVVQKRQAPERLADAMTPEFVRFFERGERFGFIHAITTPPKSEKFASEPHVMDFVCSAVAPAIGTEFVPFFEPWTKSTLGRYAKRGDLRVKPYVGQFVGKIVWVLDDITSTNTTLRESVQALVGLGIHAHGLAYVVL